MQKLKHGARSLGLVFKGGMVTRMALPIENRHGTTPGPIFHLVNRPPLAPNLLPGPQNTPDGPDEACLATPLTRWVRCETANTH